MIIYAKIGNIPEFKRIFGVYLIFVYLCTRHFITTKTNNKEIY